MFKFLLCSIAKFHVPSDYPYVAYFVAHILEFQFLRSLCMAAGQYEPKNPEKPLHKCDLEGSKIAGQRLRDGLSMGSSKHWSEALSVITNGERELSADAIVEYFKPLHEFLIKENQKSRGEILQLNCIPKEKCFSYQVVLFRRRIIPKITF